MKLWSFLRRLLPVLAIVGLIVAPLAAPAGAGTVMAASMPEMADGMPCCPTQPSTADCGKDVCPVFAACMAKCLQSAPAIGATLLPSMRTGMAVGFSADDWWAGLTPSPPARPPRT